jgi:hypothetical protein
MPLFKRPDGFAATDVAPFRRMMPFLMRTRTESAVYFEQDLDLTKTQQFIDEWNASHTQRITVFHLFVDEQGKVTSRKICSVKYTFDERIEDGLYCAHSLELLRTMIEDPAAFMESNTAPSLALAA